MLNVQGDLRRRLAAALAPVPVRVAVPDERPEELVVVTRGGGRRLNRLQDAPGIDVYCWAATEQRAWEIAEAVSDAMAGLSFADGYEAVTQNDMQSDRDLKSGSPRWYLSYTLVTHEPRD